MDYSSGKQATRHHGKSISKKHLRSIIGKKARGLCASSLRLEAEHLFALFICAGSGAELGQPTKCDKKRWIGQRIRLAACRDIQDRVRDLTRKGLMQAAAAVSRAADPRDRSCRREITSWIVVSEILQACRPF